MGRRGERGGGRWRGVGDSDAGDAGDGGVCGWVGGRCYTRRHMGGRGQGHDNKSSAGKVLAEMSNGGFTRDVLTLSRHPPQLAGFTSRQ